jgi:hypothetical protein
MSAIGTVLSNGGRIAGFFANESSGFFGYLKRLYRLPPGAVNHAGVS